MLKRYVLAACLLLALVAAAVAVQMHPERVTVAEDGITPPPGFP